MPEVVPEITTLNFAIPTDLSTSNEERSEVSESDIQAAMLFENYESPAAQCKAQADAAARVEGVTSPRNVQAFDLNLENQQPAKVNNSRNQIRVLSPKHAGKTTTLLLPKSQVTLAQR